jgi:4-amino-4-deoxy-L-arabinose transferase-like glycosyltransferase
LEAAPVNPRWAFWRTWLVPAVLLLAVTLPHLDQGDWQRTDSGRYAAIGLQAWRTGDLWTPQSEPGVPYFAKPPMVLWIHGLSLRVLGVGPLQARLPSVLAALGCVLLGVSITRRLAGAAPAVVAGGAMALTYEFFRRTREISLDMWQLLFMLGGLALIVRAATRDRSTRTSTAGLFAAAGACFGLALLCKPLVALTAPLLAAIWLVWMGRGRLAAWSLASAVAALLVAAPWHLGMWWAHGDRFLSQYFGREIVARAAGALPDSEGGRVPAWFYVTGIAATYWPWLPLACVGAARGRRAPAAWRLAVLWFIAWLVLLTAFPDRRDRYALPLHAGLAMLAGLALTEPVGARARGLLAAVVDKAVPVAAGLAVFIALLPIQVQRPPEPQWEELFAWIDAHAAEHGHPPELWQGAFGLERGARLYLRYGVWPRTTRDGLGNSTVDRLSTPPAGSLLIYHSRDGLSPGPNETPLFAVGDLLVTRLESAGWNPAG